MTIVLGQRRPQDYQVETPLAHCFLDRLAARCGLDRMPSLLDGNRLRGKHFDVAFAIEDVEFRGLARVRHEIGASLSLLYHPSNGTPPGERHGRPSPIGAGFVVIAACRTGFALDPPRVAGRLDVQSNRQ